MFMSIFTMELLVEVLRETLLIFNRHQGGVGETAAFGNKRKPENGEKFAGGKWHNLKLLTKHLTYLNNWRIFYPLEHKQQLWHHKLGLIKYHSSSYCLGMPSEMKTQYRTFQEYLVDIKHRTSKNFFFF